MKFSRKEIWMHNSFLGTCAFASKGMSRIIDSSTASPHSKALARSIQDKLNELCKSLKARANAN